MSGPLITGYWYIYGIPGVSYVYMRDPANAKRAKARYDVDLRIEKIFRVRGVRLQLSADIFNALNTPNELWDYWSRYDGNYGKKYSVPDPRTFHVGARVIF